MQQTQDQVRLLKATIAKATAKKNELQAKMKMLNQKYDVVVGGGGQAGGCFFSSGFSKPVPQQSYLAYEDVDYSQRLRNDPTYRSISPSGGGAKKKNKKKKQVINPKTGRKVTVGGRIWRRVFRK